MTMGRPMTPMCRVMTSMRRAIANMRHAMMCLGFVMAAHVHEAVPRLSRGHRREWRRDRGTGLPVGRRRWRHAGRLLRRLIRRGLRGQRRCQDSQCKGCANQCHLAKSFHEWIIACVYRSAIVRTEIQRCRCTAWLVAVSSRLAAQVRNDECRAPAAG